MYCWTMRLYWGYLKLLLLEVRANMHTEREREERERERGGGGGGGGEREGERERRQTDRHTQLSHVPLNTLTQSQNMYSILYS